VSDPGLPQTIVSEGDTWLDSNRAALQGSLDRVRGHLQQRAGRVGARPSADRTGATRGDGDPAGPDLGLDDASALGLLRDIFALTPFETDLLVLCAGIELDGSYPALCAAAAGDPLRAEPTFSLALATLPDAHWSALSASAPLRRWSLIGLAAAPPGGVQVLPLTRLPLRIDERVLHFLVGLDSVDVRLRGVVHPVAPVMAPLSPAHERVAQSVVALWSAGQGVVHLAGQGDTCAEVAARAGGLTGLSPRVLWTDDLPTDPALRDELAMLVTRDGLLGGGPVVLREAVDAPTPHRLAAELGGCIVVIAPERPDAAGVISLDVPPLTRDEQRGLWAGAGPLGAESPAVDATTGPAIGPGAGSEVSAERLSAQFHLSAAEIRDAVAEVAATGTDPWTAARHRSRRGLERLAPRVETTATWDDLVLPEDVAGLLREIVAQVRHRHTVFGQWGMRSGALRGWGVSALFAGASGTGKTLASEVIAGELALDLFRVDLSQVVSKYIGETEKNLGQVFDAADRGGCVLLLDEADALFGKRSETKDAHDRYANLEVAYLLQRMEAFRGLAVLTTNLRDNLDPAFMRRLQFVVPFPFPDVVEREGIWRRMIPDTVPTEGLEYAALGRLVVSGGVIRNIALGACFLAAHQGGPLRMEHLLRVARRECTKLERPLPEAEVGDWT
jgi:ATPase family associated with various cellular activities (AAA)